MEPLKHAPPLLSQYVWCVYYYCIISPGVYIENDLTHLLTCHLIGDGHPKSLTSTHLPTVGHHSPNEPLDSFCGDYPLSLTMSAKDRAGTILQWFLALQSDMHMWEAGQVMGGGENFIISCLWFLSLFHFSWTEKTLGTGKVTALSTTA